MVKKKLELKELKEEIPVKVKTEKLFKVTVNKRALTQFGALEVAGNPHHVPLHIKKRLKELGYIE